MSGSDFWDSLLKEADLSGGYNTSIDDHLQGREIGGDFFESLQDLTDKGRAAKALSLPVKQGTRVVFQGNLGAVLSYADPPEPNSEGVVVNVKSANGNVTSHDGMVFVQWSDGKFRSVHAEHLRLATTKKARQKTSPSKSLRVASIGDLTEFLRVAEDTLIHKSTRDLWSFHRDGNEYVIERLFDDEGEPLKG